MHECSNDDLLASLACATQLPVQSIKRFRARAPFPILATIYTIHHTLVFRAISLITTPRSLQVKY